MTLGGRRASLRSMADDPNRSPSPLRILLIEDDPAVREVIAIMLASLGHAVIEAGGGREGLAHLEAGRGVDLVLTDLRMPEMSGWEVVKQVRARWPHLRIALISGTPEALWETRQEVDVVITKPVTVDGLRQALRRATS